MSHWMFWSIVAALAFLAGAALFVFGIVFRHRMTEDTSSFSLAREEQKKATITFGGAIAWPGLGLVCWGIATACVYWGVLPAFPEQPPKPAVASDLPTPDPSGSSPDPSTAPPEPSALDPVSFKTPRGVICSTYVDRAAMACVIFDHPGWGDQECSYAFTLARTGEATTEDCPKTKALIRDLAGYSEPDQTFTDEDYGLVFDMGVAVCVMSGNGTYCVNSDRHYIRLSTLKSHPRV